MYNRHINFLPYWSTGASYSSRIARSVSINARTGICFDLLYYLLLFFSGATILRLWFVTKVLVIHQVFIPRNVVVVSMLLSGLRPL